MGSKYWCGNTSCIWNDKRKCTMDAIAYKYCENKKRHSVIVFTNKKVNQTDLRK